MLAVDIPHDHGVWAVPAGPAPTFFFHRTTVVSFKLAAKQAGGRSRERGDLSVQIPYDIYVYKAIYYL